MGKLEGTGTQKYLSITYGFISECLFHLGQAEQAAEPASQALELCERGGDSEGATAYLRHLYEIHRYLGQGDLASDYAARLAAVLRLDRRCRRSVVVRQAIGPGSCWRAAEPCDRLHRGGALRARCRPAAADRARAVRLRAQSDLAPNRRRGRATRRGARRGRGLRGRARGVPGGRTR